MSPAAQIAKIVERWRRGTTNIRGAAPPALENATESLSQPSRAGLKFGYRPYGPGSDLPSIFEFPHRLGRAGDQSEDDVSAVGAALKLGPLPPISLGEAVTLLIVRAR